MGKYTMFVCALVLGMFVQLSMQADPPIPQEVLDYAAARTERYHHSFFHNTRMLFTYIGPKEQAFITKLGWKPPRPAKGYNAAGEIIINGDAGEDFLFMHRRMIQAVNKIAEEAGSAWRVKGWTRCPVPGDKTFPVPASYDTGSAPLNAVIDNTKTEEFYWDTIAPMEDWLNDADNLRSITLGELGVKLEFEIHTWFHLRFSAANSVGYREQSFHPTAEIDEKWDDLSYNWLADFYSAHVNPTFWKIHGWIESKIEAWRVANGLDRIHWIGTWEGGPMAVLDDLYQAALVTEDPVVPPTSAESSDDTSDTVEIDKGLLANVVKLLLQASQQL